MKADLTNKGRLFNAKIIKIIENTEKISIGI